MNTKKKLNYQKKKKINVKKKEKKSQKILMICLNNYLKFHQKELKDQKNK